MAQKKSSSNKATKTVTKMTKKAVKKAAKKNPALVIVILIIVLALIVGAGFLIYHFASKNKSDNHSHDHQVTEIENPDISIYFLELGNEYTGDSTYIKAGDVDILIDACSRNASAGTISSFVDEYCTDGKLEYVIATHAHQDHIAGFVGTNSVPGIFEKYECLNIIDFNLHNTTSKVYNDYITKRDAEVASGAKHFTALDCWNQTNGGKRKYQLTERVEMEILYQDFYEKESDDENNYSVCVMFNNMDNHYLFTGDLEKAGEKSLVAKNTLPQVQLFKGAHHGSYTANTLDLLNVIKPEVVCICCCAGSDEYTTNPANMFPAQAAIDRLGLFTDKIYVTTVVDDKNKYKSLNGNILFASDGSKYAIKGSASDTILKDTEWFKANRTWPTK
jgi:beta-lactamase superfamily II metal-dependent hydrolase